MCHSLANMEHHHFKFEAHRRPGDIHVHFFGADAFSFGEGVQLADGDWMQVRFDGFGKPLRNPRAHRRRRGHAGRSSAGVKAGGNRSYGRRSVWVMQRREAREEKLKEYGSTQPPVHIAFHKFVVGQMRVCSHDTVDLLQLTR